MQADGVLPLGQVKTAVMGCEFKPGLESSTESGKVALEPVTNIKVTVSEFL